MIETLPQLAPLVKYNRFGDFHTYGWGDLVVVTGGMRASIKQTWAKPGAALQTPL